MLDDKFKALIYSFPSLARRAPKTLEDLKMIAWDPHGASGAISAACFALSVWNPYSYQFVLADAWGRWDVEHRAAWKAWAADPWWA